jgi:hypothetical protein
MTNGTLRHSGHSNQKKPAEERCSYLTKNWDDSINWTVNSWERVGLGTFWFLPGVTLVWPWPVVVAEEFGSRQSGGGRWLRPNHHTKRATTRPILPVRRRSVRHGPTGRLG